MLVISAIEEISLTRKTETLKKKNKKKTWQRNMYIFKVCKYLTH